MKKIKKNNDKNIFFPIFFSVFFTLYQFVGVQIVLFVLLALYVFHDLYKNRKMIIDKKSTKNLLFFIIWFGLFTLYAFISRKWSIGIVENSRTLSTLLRIMIVGLLLFIYCDTKEKTIMLIKSYIYGVFIMGIVIFALTPPELYGVETGTENFGSIIYQHRNAIASAAAEAILYIVFLKKFFDFKFSKFLIIFFIVLILCSGSRGAIIELIAFFILYFLINLKNKRMYKYIPVIILMLLISYFLIINIPYLSDKIFNRFLNMINTLTGGSNMDGSTYSRHLMKRVAYVIFQTHPIKGAGVDGVAAYLSLNPVQFGYTFRAVYSHCNYAELAADFGIIGLILWYTPILILIKSVYTKVHNNEFIILKHALCIFITILFLDNYKIPWTNYLPMFSFFCTLLLLLNYSNDDFKESSNQEV